MNAESGGPEGPRDDRAGDQGAGGQGEGQQPVDPQAGQQPPPGWQGQPGQQQPGWGQQQPGWGQQQPGWGHQQPGWGQQPAWGQQQWGAPQVREQPPLGIAALIAGIAGLTVLPVIASVAAVILGYAARSTVRQDPYRYSDTLGLIGRVLGWIGVGLGVLFLLFIGFFFSLPFWDWS